MRLGLGFDFMALVLLCSPLSASAQTASAQTGAVSVPPLPEQTAPHLSHRHVDPSGVAGGRIAIDVLVRDVSGKIVSGLGQGDFTLLDSRQPRPILSFQAFPGAHDREPAEPPTEVVLLIDATNTTFQRVAYERFQIDAFLRRNGGHLMQPTSVMVFSDDGVKVQPRPSTDGNQIARLLDAFETGAHNIPLARGYDAIERMSLSLKTLNQIAMAEEQKPGRKLLLWIGPGWPMLASSGYEVSANDRRSLFKDVVEVSQALREARLALYSVHMIDPGAPDQMHARMYRDFLKSPRLAKDVDPGDLSLPVLALHSGGRAFDLGGDLAADLASCFADASAYYRLSFGPPKVERVDEYHELRIEFNRPGMHAQTSAGYYAEPIPH